MELIFKDGSVTLQRRHDGTCKVPYLPDDQFNIFKSTNTEVSDGRFNVVIGIIDDLPLDVGNIYEDALNRPKQLLKHLDKNGFTYGTNYF